MTCEQCAQYRLKIGNLEAKLRKAEAEIEWGKTARLIEKAAVAAGFGSSSIPDVLSRARRVDGEWVSSAEHGALVRQFGLDALDDRANKLTIKTWIANLKQDAEAANWLTGASAGASSKQPVAGPMGKNPWIKGPNWNMTEQGKVFRENPALAKQLAAQA